ncbi:MAG: hypothetical protein GY750_07515 [Lentisphaerae bacterium]|nr:hypothetical protein [Lentisphaerota bacterium]MCP4101255.1 hypothetical protein [Lentisphaerota bacterium]
MDIDWNIALERLQAFSTADWVYAGIIIVICFSFFGYGLSGILARKITSKFGRRYEGGKAVFTGLVYCIIAAGLMLAFVYKFSKTRLPEFHNSLKAAFSSQSVDPNQNK